MPHSSSKSGTLAGRWFLALLGLSLALIGGLFVWLMARSYLRAREMRSWPEVSCEILSSGIVERRHDENSPLEFRHELTFGYQWQGAPRTSDHLTLRTNAWSSNRGKVEKQAAEYRVGTATTCRVSPTTPDLAVLKMDSLAPGYSIWFPALFVVGGLGITLRAMIRKSD
ncbi:MAG TPA: DUF3592 domain-containing protein [Luteolibacter sp.]